MKLKGRLEAMKKARIAQGAAESNYMCLITCSPNLPNASYMYLDKFLAYAWNNYPITSSTLTVIEMLYRETSLCAEGEYEMSYEIKIIAQIYKLHTS